MCNVYCRELKGWCRSFTRTETVLLILQLFLLIVFIGFLVFLILHFLACHTSITSYEVPTQTINMKVSKNTSAIDAPVYRITKNNISTTLMTTTHKKKTFNEMLECSWRPSHKTVAETRFFDITSSSYKTKTETTTDNFSHSTVPYYEYFDGNGEKVMYNRNQIFKSQVDNKSELIYNDVAVFDDDDDETDDESVDETQPNVVLALVKMKPPSGVTFGCILTIITTHWTITAASCIQYIEEIDSLDDYVMMEGYGSVKKGRTHTVSNVQIHPSYERVNRTYDLAALKSASNLLTRSMTVQLPSLLDYFMITIGERFHILGYGPFRSIDEGPVGKRLRKVAVYSLPLSACPKEAGRVLRHLWAVETVEHAACGGAAALCAGVRYARGLACSYCAGTPLLGDVGGGALLYGVMSDDRQCGLTCEPQLYVNIAAARVWLDSLLGN